MRLEKLPIKNIYGVLMRPWVEGDGGPVDFPRRSW